MKTLYFDSNYLFRLYSNDVGFEKVQELANCAELIEEVRLQMQDDLRDGVVSYLPWSEEMVRLVETTLAHAPRDTFIRAADALHLACAVVNGFDDVYSNDRHFLAAAPLFGLRGMNVISA